MLRWCKDNQLSQPSHAFSFVLLLPHFAQLFYHFQIFHKQSGVFFVVFFRALFQYNMLMLECWTEYPRISSRLLSLSSLSLSSGLSPCCLQLAIILIRTGCLTPWKMHEDPCVQKIFKNHFIESVAITH